MPESMTPEGAARQLRSLPAAGVTVELWLRGYTVFFPGARSPATQRHDDYMLDPFIARHGRKLLAVVTPLVAQQWALAHPFQVKYLKRAWAKAVLQGMVPLNVWNVVEMPRRTKPQRPVPSLAELDAALGRARARGGWWLEFADLVEVAAFTGARQGGVRSLGRSEVDLGARRVTLTEKGEKTRTVVLAARSLDAMTVAMSRHPLTRLVFLSRTGAPLRRDVIASAWREIRGDFAGPFHSLKHFAGTWLAAQGVGELDIAIQLGHTDQMGRPYPELVRRVYVHPDHSDALDRIERMIEGEAPCPT